MIVSTDCDSSPCPGNLTVVLISNLTQAFSNLEHGPNKKKQRNCFPSYSPELNVFIVVEATSTMKVLECDVEEEKLQMEAEIKKKLNKTKQSQP